MTKQQNKPVEPLISEQRFAELWDRADQDAYYDRASVLVDAGFEYDKYGDLAEDYEQQLVQWLDGRFIVDVPLDQLAAIASQIVAKYEQNRATESC